MNHNAKSDIKAQLTNQNETESCVHEGCVGFCLIFLRGGGVTVSPRNTFNSELLKQNDLI